MGEGEERALRARAVDRVAAELRKRGVVAVVKDGKLRMFGQTIPIYVREERAGGMWRHGGRAPSGRFRLTIDRLWSEVTWRTILPAKQFMQAKARADTDGFDIPKVATHVEKWARGRVEAVGARKSQDDWEKVEKRLRKGYGEMAHIRATPDGLRLDLKRLDEETALAVLKLVAGKRDDG